MDLLFNALGQQTEVNRYRDTTGTNLVAKTSFGYDALARLTNLNHTQNTISLAGYSWAYDSASRVTSFTSLNDGTNTYSYDETNQLTGADSDYQDDEIYAYDANGNRQDFVIGDHNLLLSDGTWNYEYDHEGNRTAQVNIATNERREFSWDHRNRLTGVTFKDSSGAVTKTVTEGYDVFDRRISKAVDAALERYVYDGDDVVLDFVGTVGSSELPALSRRYLFGPVVDQVFAQEDVTADANSGSRVLWQLTDNLSSTRDVVDNQGFFVVHFTYDSFGKLTSGSESVVTRYLYTGREWDADAQLQYSRARWYDPVAQRWISVDPIGFVAGDANVGRYVGNGPTNATDPSGHSKKGVDGTPNMNSTMAELVKQNPAQQHWLVICTNNTGNAPGVTGLAGHAWMAIIDTKTKVITSRGFYPDGTTEISPGNPSSGGVLKDDSKRQFENARAYGLTKQQYDAISDHIKKLEKASLKYHLADNNCSTFACDTLVIGSIVGRPNLPTSSHPVQKGDPKKPDYNPGELAKFLKGPQTYKGIMIDLKK